MSGQHDLSQALENLCACAGEVHVLLEKSGLPRNDLRTLRERINSACDASARFKAINEPQLPKLHSG